jgi:Peptidase family M1 domain
MHYARYLSVALLTLALCGVAYSQAAPPPAGLASLDLADQAVALRPPFAADLRDAGQWDRYTIRATLDPAKLTVSGGQLVEFTNRSAAPLSAIYFHLYPNHPGFGGRLDVTAARVDGQPVGSGVENRDTLLRLDLRQPLAPGAAARIELEFTTRSPRSASAKRYGAFNQEAGVWALADFYPLLARYFPETGWDRRPVESRGDFVVSTTALYDVTLDTPSDWSLAASGTRLGEPENLSNGLRREQIVSGPQREFFIAALKGLDQASSTVEGTRITTYYQRDEPEAGRRSLAVAERSLRAFTKAYGPYPFGELEIVQAALTNFLGVEYPGVVLIEQRLYEQNSRGLETTVAHEVAHQWWYGLVGNDAQGEAWLDEGLASFSQLIYYRSLGDTAQAARELQGFRDSYNALRNRGADGAMNRSPAEMRGGTYVPLVYAKAALFFEALRLQIGDAAFTRFVQGYFSGLRYREATGPDLLAAAEAGCSCELDSFYRDWVTTAAPVKIP